MLFTMHINDVLNSVDPDGLLYFGTSTLGLTVCLSHTNDMLYCSFNGKHQSYISIF